MQKSRLRFTDCRSFSQKIVAALRLFACKRAHDVSACFGFFAICAPAARKRRHLYHTRFTIRGKSFWLAAIFMQKSRLRFTDCRSFSQKIVAALRLFACKRAHDVSACFGFFAICAPAARKRRHLYRTRFTIRGKSFWLAAIFMQKINTHQLPQAQ